MHAGFNKTVTRHRPNLGYAINVVATLIHKGEDMPQQISNECKEQAMEVARNIGAALKQNSTSSHFSKAASDVVRASEQTSKRLGDKREAAQKAFKEAFGLAPTITPMGAASINDVSKPNVPDVRQASAERRI